MRFEFDAEIIYWRGPAPFFYAPVPIEQADGHPARRRSS